MTSSFSPWPEAIYILIPAYKAATTLKPLLSKLTASVPPSNICVVDDASKDGTDSICSNFGVGYVAHETNRGKGAALTTGFNHILQRRNPEWVITMDADGQHAVEDLTHFVNWSVSERKSGMCIGARSVSPSKMPPARIVSNILTSQILSILTGYRIPDSQCGFRMYSETLLRNISCEYLRFEMESEIILKAAFFKFPISSIPVQTLYLNGQSHIEHLHDTLRWIRSVLVVWWKLRSKPFKKVLTQDKKRT